MTSFIFNGFNFAELIRVNDIQRPLLPALNTVLTDVGSLKGSLFNYNSYSQREISVDFTLLADSPDHLVSVKQLVAGKLFTEAPAQLIFSDSPDRYFLAILDGDTELDQTSGIAQGSLTFLVPDGVAHAVNVKEFVAAQNSAGVLEVEVDNAGTEACPVDIEATFSSDNGVFAVISPYGVMEVGSAEEVDGHNYQETDVVAKNTLAPEDKENWEENSLNARTVYPTTLAGNVNAFGVGNWTWASGSDGPTPIYTSRLEGIWSGPTLHREIPANSNGSVTGNFEGKWRFEHVNNGVRQAGRQEFNFQSGEDVPFAIVIRDGSFQKVEKVVEFYIAQPGQPKQVTSMTLDVKKLRGDWYEAKVTRIGAKVTFTLSNIASLTGGAGDEDVKSAYVTVTKTFTLDWAEGLPIDSTTCWSAAGGGETTDPLGMYPLNFTFRWINVEKYADDPNRYTEADAMYIDSSDGKVYLNGAPIMNDIVKGSEFIKVPVGKTKLQFAYSSFATVPAVRALIQEVYL